MLLYFLTVSTNNRYFSTALDRIQYVSTVLDRKKNVLHQSRSKQDGFDRARCTFRPCSRYVSTELEVFFDRAKGIFRRSLRCFLIVLEVFLDRARGIFRLCSGYLPTILDSTVLDMFRQCSRYFSVSTKLLRSSTDMCSTLKVDCEIILIS